MFISADEQLRSQLGDAPRALKSRRRRDVRVDPELLAEPDLGHLERHDAQRLGHGAERAGQRLLGGRALARRLGPERLVRERSANGGRALAGTTMIHVLDAYKK